MSEDVRARALAERENSGDLVGTGEFLHGKEEKSGCGVGLKRSQSASSIFRSIGRPTSIELVSHWQH